MVAAGILASSLIPLPAQEQATPVPSPSPDSTAAELEEQGDALRSQKAYLDSIDYYHAALRKANTAILHNKAGISYFQMFRDRDAKKEYEQAIRLNQGYAEAHNNLGALYYREERHRPAIREYKKATHLSDANAIFHSNLGTACFAAKDFTAAAREYSRASVLDPNIFDRQTPGGTTIRMISSADLGHFHYVMAQIYGRRGDEALLQTLFDQSQ